MIMKWLFLLCTLKGIGSTTHGIDGQSILTEQENREVNEKCGVFDLDAPSDPEWPSDPIGKSLWLFFIDTDDLRYGVAVISEKHALTNSGPALYRKGKDFQWMHNQSDFDLTAYCKERKEYLEVPAEVIEYWKSDLRNSIERAYILKICEPNDLKHFPMVIVLAKRFGSFACIADGTSELSGTEAYSYNSHRTNARDIYRHRIKIKSNGSLVDLDYAQYYFGGPIATVIKERVTVVGIITSEEDLPVDAVRTVNFEAKLCKLFAICSKKKPKVIRTTTTQKVPFDSKIETEIECLEDSETNDPECERILEEHDAEQEETAGSKWNVELGVFALVVLRLIL